MGTEDSLTAPTTATASVLPAPPLRIMQVLALVMMVGFFGVIGLLVFVEIPQQASTVLSMMLGSLTAGVSMVLSYYFGSSQGSARKTEVLSQELADKK